MFAAFEPDAYGYTEQAYVESLKRVIWTRTYRPLYSDGMKYGPWPSDDCRLEHPWFDAYCAAA